MSRPVTNQIGLTDLKARLSQHVRSVKSGREIVITQNDIPVARMVPYRAAVSEGSARSETLTVQAARRAFESMRASSPVKLPKPKLSASEILFQIRKERF